MSCPASTLEPALTTAVVQSGSAVTSDLAILRVLPWSSRCPALLVESLSRWSWDRPDEDVPAAGGGGEKSGQTARCDDEIDDCRAYARRYLYCVAARATVCRSLGTWDLRDSETLKSVMERGERHGACASPLRRCQYGHEAQRTNYHKSIQRHYEKWLIEWWWSGTVYA